MTQQATKAQRVSVIELRVAAEVVLLDIVRQAPRLHFTAAERTAYLDDSKVRKTLGMAKDDSRELEPILTVAAAKLNKKLRQFQVKVELSSRSQTQLTARLADGSEWQDAIREAWSYSNSPNEHALTDPAVGLVEFIRSGDLEPDFISERSISWKMGLNGRERCIEPYLREVRTKTQMGLHWERKGTQWGERPMYRLWIEADEGGTSDQPDALNPKIERHLDRFTKDDLDQVRAQIYNWLLELKPDGTDDAFFLSISSRAELIHCLPFPQSRSTRVLAEFFSALALNPAISRGYDFRDEAECWTVSLHPKPDWSTALEAIRQEVAQPNLQERFGLSDEAAKLLDWVEHLPEDKKLLGRVTPIVEEAASKFIGIKCPWSEDNAAVYLQLLIDEINDRTDYELRLQPWHEYTRVRSRILIKKKRTAMEEILNQLALLASTRGHSLHRENARRAIEEIISRQ